MMQKLHKKVMMTFVLVGFIVLSAEADPTLTYYKNGVETTHSTWSNGDHDTGWKYGLETATYTLTLTNSGPYKLSGTATDFKVVVSTNCTLTLDSYNSSMPVHLLTQHLEPTIQVNSGATLTLLIDEGTSTLQSGGDHAGINVQKDGTLIIDKVEGKTDAQCVLNVTGGDDGAGIGANRDGNCGDITINGGTINATGGSEAAGIGGGNVTTGYDVTVGTIKINGGIVNATGTKNSAGIGTGLVEGGGKVTVTKIEINGGTVTATGNGRAAGIGLGQTYLGTSSATSDSIEISGGDVTANGGDEGAGIGTGVAQGQNTQSTVSSIVISGGTVTATKGANAEGDDIGCATSSHSTGATTMDSVTVTGGCIAEGTSLTNPKTAEDTTTGTPAVAVQAVKLQNDGWSAGQEIAISGLSEGYGTNDVYVSESKSVIVYLPEGNYSPEVDGEWYVVTNANNQVKVEYCHDGFDGTSQPAVTALNSDGANILFTFSVPLLTGIDFSRWVESELARRKFAVLLADTASALADADVEDLVADGTADGARLIYVDTSEVSQDSAQYVSKDATGSLVTVRVPLPLEALCCRLYRIFVLRN